MHKMVTVISRDEIDELRMLGIAFGIFNKRLGDGIAFSDGNNTDIHLFGKRILAVCVMSALRNNGYTYKVSSVDD